MAERDIITMSQKELKRLHIIHRVREGFLTQKQAADTSDSKADKGRGGSRHPASIAG